jgi:hypothetical protein
MQMTTDAGAPGDNPDAGRTSSAEEMKARIAEGAATREHGSSEGMPDPVTAENSPEEVGTQKEGMQEVNAQDPVVPPIQDAGGTSPQR